MPFASWMLETVHEKKRSRPHPPRRHVTASKSYLPFAAENFFGATGRGRLNAKGDRAFGDYDVWALRMAEGTPQWTSVANCESGEVRIAGEWV